MTHCANNPVVVDEVRHALAGVVAVARELTGDAVRVQTVEVAPALELQRRRQVTRVAGTQFGLDGRQMPLNAGAIELARIDRLDSQSCQQQRREQHPSMATPARVRVKRSVPE